MTNRFMDIVVPVATRVGDEVVASYVDARLPIVDRDEAPVVVEWEDRAIRVVNHQFRAWNGGLVGQTVVPVTVDALTASVAGGWRQARLYGPDWAKLVRQPYQDWAGLFSASASRIVDDPSAFPELERAASAAAERVAASALVDGQIWLPTDGPVLSFYTVPKERTKVHVKAPPYQGPLMRTEQLPRTTTAFDMDTLVARLREAFGDLDVVGSDPIVHSSEGWDLSAIRARSDANMLKVMLEEMALFSQDEMGSFSPKAVESMVAVRELASRDRVGSTAEMMEAAREHLRLREARPLRHEQRKQVDEWDLLLSMAEGRDLHAPELAGFSV